MSEITVFFIDSIVYIVTVIGAGIIFTIGLFNIPKNYKEGKKFQCFIYLTLLAVAFAALVRLYS